eukprot:CAMPEP_0202876322 /NCGR_PEP_ID=MMETSP1391-20130828/28808_1 /ASSEMBLY_ACC=CAM_ASM_000867 /TAXON_ID=1034604 /ORGANISM="Chlamydomonas leiostraca, Strain SAG 11-49" /LENGTH=81 /DNA_ID=CAMNT_0049558141 /DNA_START=29 /DNA_END=270 /DNA_ORIENTATION=+
MASWAPRASLALCGSGDGSLEALAAALAFTLPWGGLLPCGSASALAASAADASRSSGKLRRAPIPRSLMAATSYARAASSS